jgi:predicted RNase H-like HicB family nuclease
MLIEYVDEAMSKAQYDKLEDGSYYGKIPQCPGVVALAETLYKCERELRSALEGWLIVKLRHGDRDRQGQGPGRGRDSRGCPIGAGNCNRGCSS